MFRSCLNHNVIWETLPRRQLWIQLGVIINISWSIWRLVTASSVQLWKTFPRDKLAYNCIWKARNVSLKNSCSFCGEIRLISKPTNSRNGLGLGMSKTWFDRQSEKCFPEQPAYPIFWMFHVPCAVRNSIFIQCSFTLNLVSYCSLEK